MTPNTPRNIFSFERMFVCVAILGPIVMVIVAGTRPDGSRGRLIVTGHECLVAVLALAVIVRALYLRAITRRAASFHRPSTLFASERWQESAD